MPRKEVEVKLEPWLERNNIRWVPITVAAFCSLAIIIVPFLVITHLIPKKI